MVERSELYRLIRTGDIFEGENVLARIKDKLDDRVPVEGIYFLFSGTGVLLYIGKSVNLRSRLYAHLSGCDYGSEKFTKFINKVVIVYMDDCDNRKRLLNYEAAFISEFKPCFNGVPGNVKGFGYKSLYEEKKMAQTAGEIESLIRQWRPLDIANELIDREGTIINTTEPNYQILSAVREAIKLVVIHANDEYKDEIIDGLLASIRAS